MYIMTKLISIAAGVVLGLGLSGEVNGHSPLSQPGYIVGDLMPEYKKSTDFAGLFKWASREGDKWGYLLRYKHTETNKDRYYVSF